MAQLSEQLVRDTIRIIDAERKLQLTVNEVRQLCYAWLDWNKTDSVPIPKNEAQAELMQKLGYAWLEANAPHRLKRGAQPQGAPHD